MAKQNKKSEQKNNETWTPFRSLDNYKSMHRKLAESKGKLEQFLAAPTLTAARRIAFGR